MTAQIISPGVRDHFIISIELCYESKKNGYKMKPYHKADVNQLLANMTNVNNMWNAFVDELKIAINKSVLVKQIRPKTMNQPIWFTRSATRIVKITGKLITSHRQPFFQRQV